MELDPIVHGDYIMTREQDNRLRMPFSHPVRKFKYDWKEVWAHNILKFFGIKSTIMNEEIHEKSKKN